MPAFYNSELHHTRDMESSLQLNQVNVEKTSNTLIIAVKRFITISKQNRNHAVKLLTSHKSKKK